MFRKTISTVAALAAVNAIKIQVGYEDFDLETFIADYAPVQESICAVPWEN
jgi:hypothetical protein